MENTEVEILSDWNPSNHTHGNMAFFHLLLIASASKETSTYNETYLNVTFRQCLSTFYIAMYCRKVRHIRLKQ